MRIGVVDIGSSSVRLQIIDSGPGAAPLAAYGRKWAVRLAERARADGRVTCAGETALLRALEDLVDEARRRGVDELLVFATAALRAAANREAVIDRIKAEVGLDVRVLGGEDEARFTFLATRRWLGWRAGPLLVLDIGGGSLEVARGRDEYPDLAVSVDLGAGHLARKYLHHDPPAAAELAALRAEARSSIREVADRLRWEGPPGLAVGTSSTFRRLARLTGAPSRRHGPFAQRSLRRSKLHRLIPELSAMKAGERAGLPGVSTGRSVQLVAGALVADVVMKALSIDMLDVSPWALREGVLASRLDGLTDPDQIHANRLVSAAVQHVEHGDRDSRVSDGVTAMVQRRR